MWLDRIRGAFAAAVVTTALLAASGSPAASSDRFSDAVGDATGATPDIVAVTIEAATDSPLISITVEFAAVPPLTTDMETWTDVVFIELITDPELDVDGEASQRVGPAGTDADFLVGSHAVTLPDALVAGGHLYVAAGLSDLYWHVVDVVADGPALTWRFDRKLIGEPRTLGVVVLAGVEREDATELEGDLCPDEGAPILVHTL